MDSQPLLVQNEANSSNGQNFNAQPVISAGTNIQVITQNDPLGPNNIQNYQSQIDYSKITNINQINHLTIQQIGNKFTIAKPTCEKIGPIIGAICSFLLSILFFSQVTGNPQSIDIILGIIWLIVFIIYCISLNKKYHTVSFILGQNIITIELTAIIGQRIEVYQPGQLSKVEFTSAIGRTCHCRESAINFSTIKDGISLEVNYFKEATCEQRFTDEEIGYFNYVINNHIRSNMVM